MNNYNVVGVMSGTSLDGLDIAFCNFEEKSGFWKFKIINAVTIEYPDDIKYLLKNCYRFSAFDFQKAHNQYGNFIADSVLFFLDSVKFKADIISSHGHTIFHQPDQGITFQLGNGAIITSKTGITTVSDFRTQDVANGGQGAPLVPVGDEFLFGDYTACLNLGGFSNISFKKNNLRVAFDICPVNIVLNYLAGKLGKEMDKDGEIASKGEINSKLLNDLNNLDFYQKPYPKSLGKEWVDKNIMPLFLKANFKIEDILRTLVEHIANQISIVINSIDQGTVLVTGGGAKNKFLMKKLSEKSKLSLLIPDPLIVNYKEALIFAFLGVLRLNNNINCYRSVTGAKTDLSSGVIHLAFK